MECSRPGHGKIRKQHFADTCCPCLQQKTQMSSGLWETNKAKLVLSEQGRQKEMQRPVNRGGRRKCSVHRMVCYVHLWREYNMAGMKPVSHAWIMYIDRKNNLAPAAVTTHHRRRKYLSRWQTLHPKRPRRTHCLLCQPHPANADGA